MSAIKNIEQKKIRIETQRIRIRDMKYDVSQRPEAFTELNIVRNVRTSAAISTIVLFYVNGISNTHY